MEQVATEIRDTHADIRVLGEMVDVYGWSGVLAMLADSTVDGRLANELYAISDRVKKEYGECGG